MIRENATSDFVLKANGGEEIPVHKSVLEGLWPFFKSMLATNMKEAAQGFVAFDIPGTTLQVIVRYLYGEQLSMEFEEAASFLRVWTNVQSS